MAFRRSLLILLTALLLFAPSGAVASEPPADALTLIAGEGGLAVWAGVDVHTVNFTVGGGESLSLWFAFDKRLPGPNETAPSDANGTQENATSENATAPASRTFTTYVNATSADLGIDAQLIIETDTNTSGDWDIVSTPFVTPTGVDLNATYSFTFESYEHKANETVLYAQGASESMLEVRGAAVVPVPTPPTGIPTSYYIIGGAAAVVVLGGAGVIRLRSSREKARMNRAPRRSQALREEALERVSMKRPEERAAVKAEIRQQEQVRERRRELQILDAKKMDVEKTIELLKKRQESGGLTQHQYDVMTKKKLGDLERINAEIAEMEAEDASSGAAA